MIALRAAGAWLIRTWPGRLLLAAFVGAAIAWRLYPDPVPVATSTATAATTTATARSEKRTDVSTAQADLVTIGGETVVEFNAAGAPVRISHKGGTLRLNLKTSTTATSDVAWTKTATSTVTSSASTPITTQGTAGRWGLGVAVLIPVRDRSWGISPEISYGLGELTIPIVRTKTIAAFLGVDVPFGSYIPEAARLGIRAGP